MEIFTPKLKLILIHIITGELLVKCSSFFASLTKIETNLKILTVLKFVLYHMHEENIKIMMFEGVRNAMLYVIAWKMHINKITEVQQVAIVVDLV